jgi:uncharacterized protein YidB (DUF937 family)
MAENKLQVLTLNRISEAARAHGMQKALAQDVGMTDAELSRLLNDQLPKVVRVLNVLGLEVVDANHVSHLRAVLKEVL